LGSDRHNGAVVLFEVVVVLGVVGFAFYAIVRLFTRSQHRPLPGSAGGVWRATHYDAKGVTRVVLQKTSPGGANLLDEHVVATIPLDDPEYDAKFMTAMASARERRSMFETEED
jgi:hypothetical protein